MKTFSQIRRKIPLQSPYVRVGLGIFALLATTAGGAYATYWRAETQLRKGLGALAAQTISPFQGVFTRFEAGCNVVLNAYFSAHLGEKLEWASQACIDHGHEGPATYVGVAASYEFRGRDGDALELLARIAPKYDRSPDLYYRTYQILRRNDKLTVAADNLVKAAERAPSNPEMTFEAVRLLSDLKRWKEARVFADRLRNVKTDNAQAKLVLAQVFLHTGDLEGAKSFAKDGANLVTPDLRAFTEKTYGELFRATRVNFAEAAGRGLASSPAGASAGAPADPNAGMPRNF